jgi:hypothetical protein
MVIYEICRLITKTASAFEALIRAIEAQDHGIVSFPERNKMQIKIIIC